MLLENFSTYTTPFLINKVLSKIPFTLISFLCWKNEMLFFDYVINIHVKVV